MNNAKPINPNLILQLTCVALLVLARMASSATITVLGATAPIPGPADQYQTNFVFQSQAVPPGGGSGFNYYLDANPSPGQIFTTGSNPNGYVLSSLYLWDADGTGNNFNTTSQQFHLGIYSISDTTNATLMTTYNSQSVVLPDFNWFEWTNLGAILEPNTQYAYAMWRDSSGTGWMNLGSISNSVYSGGQIVVIPQVGGGMRFSTSPNPWNASFDVGLTPITAVTVGQATFTPGGVAVPGSSVTASAAVNGPTPYFYQWKTDGGSGGALTNIAGATTSDLVINTSGFANGMYQYALLVSNSTSSATGQAGILQVQQPIGIPGVIGVKFAFTNGYATSDAPLPADNTGVPTGQIVPPSNVPLTVVGNWNNLWADVAGAGSTSAAINQSWTINHDSTGAALSGVTLAPFGFNDGWYSGGTDCAAGRLLYDCWKINSGGANPQIDGSGDLYGTLTFNNLPWGQYDVIVFVNDNNGNYWGNMQANGVVAQGGDTVDDHSFGFNGASADPCALATPLHTFGSYNGGNSANSCNYLRMANVATVGGTITITVVDFGGGDMGVSGVELVPAVDLALVQDVTPNYVETVTGQPLVLSTAFENTPPVSFQWIKIGGGVTNNVNTGVSMTTNGGVVTSSLTFNSLQVSDSAIYQAKAFNATNSFDFIYTGEAEINVSNLPSPLGNLITYKEAQVGVNYYPPSWAVNTAADLVYGFPLLAPGSSPAPGNAIPGAGGYSLNGDGSGNPGVLTDGQLGYASAFAVSCGDQGAGPSVSYFLDTNASPLGFEITNITVYAGWRDSGRRDQDYQVLYSTAEAPTNFIPLYTMLYLPADTSGDSIATRTMLIPANGVLAHNVYGLTFQFNGVPQLLNGYELYDEIVIGGANATTVAAPAQPVPVILSAAASGGNLILTGSGGSAAANNFYTLLSTTNLTPPVNWVTNLTGTVSGTGIISNAIPINLSQPGAQFFRVSIP